MAIGASIGVQSGPTATILYIITNHLQPAILNSKVLARYGGFNTVFPHFEGGIRSNDVEVHVDALPTSPPLIDIDLTPTQIAVIVICLVFLILIIAAIVICCLRGVPGKGSNSLRKNNPFLNRLRRDDPMEGSNGWAHRAEVVMRHAKN